MEVCPVHETALIERCFAGGRQPVIVRDVSVGVCGLCGAVAEATRSDEFNAKRQAWYAQEA